MQTQPLSGLLERLAAMSGRRPQGSGVYEEALTHPSFVNESGQDLPSNQRLEFLGDAVLQLITSDYVFRRHPHLAEGEMTRLRASAVREESLAAAARQLGLGAFLRLGRGE
ncbi:MAG: ribonuclease III family protein, partial [Bacillota bacterium]